MLPGLYRTHRSDVWPPTLCDRIHEDGSNGQSLIGPICHPYSSRDALQTDDALTSPILAQVRRFPECTCPLGRNNKLNSSGCNFNTIYEHKVMSLKGSLTSCGHWMRYTPPKNTLKYTRHASFALLLAGRNTARISHVKTQQLSEMLGCKNAPSEKWLENEQVSRFLQPIVCSCSGLYICCSRDALWDKKKNVNPSP